jgi:outer membrane protein TolC
VGEAKAARLPRLTLNASASAIDSEVLQLQEDFENPTAGAGARLVAPIYQGGALKTQVEIRTLEQQEAVAQYARMALRAIADVENALAAGRILAERHCCNSAATDNNEPRTGQTSYRVRADLRAVQQQQLVCICAPRLLRAERQLAQRVNHLSSAVRITTAASQRNHE